ncbi:MAG: deoxyuridine 5'-triphosphate nucleotidohydrolase [Ruminococcaceae bacterium]|nr:deoxyuridine 5'-triphosphate nucleotidohydrolase [Oscillospiraceae bacterium]
MKIKVKYHNNNIPKLQKNPKGDLIDLYAAETVELKAGEHKLISLGVSMKLPEGYKAELTPRSSTYKTWGILQWNSVGQIDNSYSGTNDIWRFPALAMRDTVIHEGDKICQFELKKATMNNVLFEESDTLDDTDRGGFGSTGRR